MNESEQPANSSSATRDDLFLKVAIVLLCLIGLNLAIGWILQFYFKQQVISNISFVGSDPSWIPKGTHFSPALGVHYFGDFEQYMGYATSSIPPYSSAIGYPAAYGPTAIMLVKLLNSMVGWPGAVFVFLIASLALFLWGLIRLLGSSLSSRLLAILLLFTGGMVVSLDRGNLQILVAALGVWFCVGFLEDRPNILIISLAFAIAIKIYVAVLVLILIKARRWRDIVLLSGLAVALYGISFALLGGNYFRDIGNFFDTNLLFASSPSHGFVLGCVSAASAVYKSLWLLWGPKHFENFLNNSPSWYVQVPGFIIGCACLIIIWISKYPREIALVAIFALMQLVPASTYPYVEINMVIELCLLLRILGCTSRDTGGGHPKIKYGSPPISRRILMICVILLVVGSAPWLGMFYGNSGARTSIGELLAPIMNIGVVIALLVGLLIGRRHIARHRHTSRSQRRLESASGNVFVSADEHSPLP